MIKHWMLLNTVAKENGYSYIIDASALIVSPPGDDILPLVKKKLGIINKTAPISQQVRAQPIITINNI